MSHLCGQCRAVICADCLAISEEYEELLLNKNRALASAQAEVDRLQAEVLQAKRRADRFEGVAKLGYPEVIQKWMDSLEAQPDPPAR